MKLFVIHRIGTIRFDDITEVILISDSSNKAKHLIQKLVDKHWKIEDMRCREIKCDKEKIITFNHENLNLVDWKL